MKRLALVHKGWSSATAITDRWRLLFEALRDECGFELCFIEEMKKAPEDTDVVLFSCAAGHFDSKGVMALYRSTNGKRIVYLADYLPDKQPRAATALNDADIILAPEAALYRKSHPGKRVEFFPYFFAPEERYTQLEWNAEPRMACLLSGPMNKNYPLRSAAFRSPLIHRLHHPGSHGAQDSRAVVGDAYAKHLNGYFCAIGGAVRGGMPTKAFEIMAAGTLLITEALPDMDEMGMRQGVHYVAASRSSVPRIIDEVLAAPGDYEPIRRAGMEYARANHSLRNRVVQLKALLEEL